MNTAYSSGRIVRLSTRLYYQSVILNLDISVRRPSYSFSKASPMPCSLSSLLSPASFNDDATEKVPNITSCFAQEDTMISARL